tara:strand:+ start:13144 stop:13908 length:765 start_codon:yes stop_codon:yes gene_type:complete
MNIKLQAYLKIKKIKQNCLITLSRISSKKKKKNFTKFIILSRSRSGSNLLVSYLDSHPNIHIRGEIFHTIGNASYLKKLSWFFKTMPDKFKASGFKIFYYHPLDKDVPGLWDKLVSDKNIKIIHLYRENLIKTVISRQIALKTNVWSSEKSSNKSSKKFEINPKVIEKEIHDTLFMKDKFNKVFSEHQKLEISYEDFIKLTTESLIKIQLFLDVPEKILKTHLKKQQTKSFNDIINNYDEIGDYFIGSNWEKYT